MTIGDFIAYVFVVIGAVVVEWIIFIPLGGWGIVRTTGPQVLSKLVTVVTGLLR